MSDSARYLWLCVLCILLSPSSSFGADDDLVFESDCLWVEREDIRDQNGRIGRSWKPAHLYAEIPEFLAKKVEHETGISAKGQYLSIVPRVTKSRIKLELRATQFAAKGSGSLPIVGRLVENDFYYRFIPVVTSATGDRFYALGLFEYNDRKNKKQCVFTCEVKGTILNVGQRSEIKLDGKAKWCGPLSEEQIEAINLEEATTNPSQSRSDGTR